MERGERDGGGARVYGGAAERVGGRRGCGPIKRLGGDLGEACRGSAA